MAVEVQRATLADGTQVLRRFEDGVFVAETRIQQFASGKTLTSEFDDAGRLRSETHSYGLLRISLTKTIDSAGRVDEQLFVNRRLVSRARYEKERALFPDMPAADGSIGDVGAALLSAMRAEQRARRANRAPADPARGARLDQFCTTLMAKPGRIDLLSSHDARLRLGEKTARAGLQFIASIKRNGALAAWGCETTSDGDAIDCDHVVIELPAEAAARAALMSLAARAARAQGFDPYQDDGQRYVYLKLA